MVGHSSTVALCQRQYPLDVCSVWRPVWLGHWGHLGDATGLYWAMVGVVAEHAAHRTAPTTVTQPQGSTVLQLRNPALELDVNSWEPSGHQGAQVTVTSWETLGKLVNLLVISKQGCFWVETEHPYLNPELRQHDYVYRLKRLSKLNEALEKKIFCSLAVSFHLMTILRDKS